jgi:(p)ppGpp synthase/HD superfamily hydrolase
MEDDVFLTALIGILPLSVIFAQRKSDITMPRDLIERVMDAAVYAALKHQYQRRSGYSRLPYINHLLKAADTLIRIGGERDETLLVAAVLHDVLEDTDATAEELAQRFSPEAAAIVQELTDDMSLPYMQRKWLQVERAHLLSEKARKIRLADKSTNIRDIFTYPLDWTWEKKADYLANSIEVAARIRGLNPKLDEWFDETAAWAQAQLAEMKKVL